MLFVFVFLLASIASGAGVQYIVADGPVARIKFKMRGAGSDSLRNLQPWRAFGSAARPLEFQCLSLLENHAS